MTTLIFPWPPSVNSLYMQGKTHGQKFLTKKGKEYKRALHDLYSDDERYPFTVPIKISMDLIPPDSRNRDSDNYVKAVFDGLTQLGYIEDDSQIKQHTVNMWVKHPDFNKGLVIITMDCADTDTSWPECFNEDTKILGSIAFNGYRGYFHKPTKKELQLKEKK
jgi:crossover junction endodeoxyribonuclease RusA